MSCFSYSSHSYFLLITQSGITEQNFYGKRRLFKIKWVKSWIIFNICSAFELHLNSHTCSYILFQYSPSGLLPCGSISKAFILNHLLSYFYQINSLALWTLQSTYRNKDYFCGSYIWLIQNQWTHMSFSPQHIIYTIQCITLVCDTH